MGKATASRMRMMLITTIISIRVNPRIPRLLRIAYFTQLEYAEPSLDISFDPLCTQPIPG